MTLRSCVTNSFRHKWHLHDTASFTRTVNITAFVSGTFDLFNVNCKQHHSTAFNPLFNRAENTDIDCTCKRSLTSEPEVRVNLILLKTRILYDQKSVRIKASKGNTMYHSMQQEIHLLKAFDKLKWHEVFWGKIPPSSSTAALKHRILLTTGLTNC